MCMCALIHRDIPDNHVSSPVRKPTLMSILPRLSLQLGQRFTEAAPSGKLPLLLPLHQLAGPALCVCVGANALGETRPLFSSPHSESRVHSRGVGLCLKA